MRIVRASLVVFIASFCTLVIEIVAGRVLAPYVGVSLYTWTSIIGVVLAGISAGAYAGGWLADRRPVDSTLGILLIAAGLTAILIAPATTACSRSTASPPRSCSAWCCSRSCSSFSRPSFSG